MANIEGIEMKFHVVKADDAQNLLSSAEKKIFDTLLDVIHEERSDRGKKENIYLVINSDEPYADEVIEIMKRHGHWG